MTTEEKLYRNSGVLKEVQIKMVFEDRPHKEVIDTLIETLGSIYRGLPGIVRGWTIKGPDSYWRVCIQVGSDESGYHKIE